jgi:hypothetical protein
VLGGFALASGVPWGRIRPGCWPAFVIGLVLMSAGIAIRRWAVALLGQFFTS